MTLGIFNSKVKHRTCRFDGLLWSDAAAPVPHTACRDSSFNLLTRPLPESIPKILSYFRAGYGQKVDTLCGLWPGLVQTQHNIGSRRSGEHPVFGAESAHLLTYSSSQSFKTEESWFTFQWCLFLFIATATTPTPYINDAHGVLDMNDAVITVVVSSLFL